MNAVTLITQSSYHPTENSVSQAIIFLPTKYIWRLYYALLVYFEALGEKKSLLEKEDEEKLVSINYLLLK